MIVHKNIFITGKVQGVGFRYTAKSMADSLGIAGFVQNQDDGSVYIEAEGIDSALKIFIEWCRTGPTYARVDSVKEEQGTVKDFETFENI